MMLTLSAILCFIHILTAQNWPDEVFGKTLEMVHEKNKKECYKGQIMEKKRDGMGVLKMKDGTMYIGDFYKGKISGMGIFLASADNCIPYCDSCIAYIGNWKDGKKSGTGTCYAGNGDVVYSGKFLNDKPVDTYPSFADYSLRCFSLVKNEDRNMFLGEIHNGQFNGLSLIIGNNGDLYIGNFKDGLKKGVWLYLRYDGEWQTLSFKGDDYNVVSSSGKYRVAEAELKQQKRYIWGKMLEGLPAVGASIVQLTNSKQSNKYGNSSIESVNADPQATFSLSADNMTGNVPSGKGQAYYQTQYTRWEQRAQANYRSLTNLGVSFKEKNSGERAGSTGQSMNSGNYVVMKKNLREAQNQMRNIRQQASRAGVTIPQSVWETATVSY